MRAAKWGLAQDLCGLYNSRGPHLFCDIRIERFRGCILRSDVDAINFRNAAVDDAAQEASAACPPRGCPGASQWDVCGCCPLLGRLCRVHCLCALPAWSIRLALPFRYMSADGGRALAGPHRKRRMSPTCLQPGAAESA